MSDGIANVGSESLSGDERERQGRAVAEDSSNGRTLAFARSTRKGTAALKKRARSRVRELLESPTFNTSQDGAVDTRRFGQLAAQNDAPNPRAHILNPMDESPLGAVAACLHISRVSYRVAPRTSCVARTPLLCDECSCRYRVDA